MIRNQRIVRNYFLFFLLGAFSPIKGHWAVILSLPILILLHWQIDDHKVNQIKKNALSNATNIRQSGR